MAIYRKALQRGTPLNVAKKIRLDRLKRVLDPADRPVRNDHDEEISHARDGFVNDYNSRVPAVHADSLAPEILLLCKQTHMEALPILYKENTLNFHVASFSGGEFKDLREKTRSLIRHAHVTINEPNDILLNGRFEDIFRSGFRYCAALESLVISYTKGPWYPAFDWHLNVLRWLPKGCMVEVTGESVSENAKKMVDEHNALAGELGLVSQPMQLYESTMYTGIDATSRAS